MTDTLKPPPCVPLYLGLMGADAPARQALATALAGALGLPCVDGPPPLSGGVSLLPLALRGQRDQLRRERPALLLVRLPEPNSPPFDEPGADESVFTAMADTEVARQVGALLPRLRRAAAIHPPEE